ncbi:MULTISPECIES: glycosyl hydrolase family 8 [Leptolyngbya]|uniref:glycosyl hydrolase family 8 n=1 Tax=Leptolyngbya TaxID=47251 RepID=UPI00168A0042|nr:glycosyl hydrolase family 8 [Leptolyngbya sp. FACHB-1624]MBD1855916.1 glycosyl hydrolase [Leptolyngbya sp. FACHB-1624]
MHLLASFKLNFSPHPRGRIRVRKAWLLFVLAIASTLFFTLSACTEASVLPKHTQLLQESWKAYRQRFIQSDGRIIDRQDTDRSISEGQAYALLRSVLVNDRDTFARVLQWSENNLKRRDAQQQQIDSLWAWKWGRNPVTHQWTTLDANFATDADIDAITALIVAARKWKHSDYLKLADTKLTDLWEHGTVLVNQRRYLLPGAIEVFRKGDQLKFNPSYLAPAAFRLFAQVDTHHDWQSLIDSSYAVLKQSTDLSTVNLPSDWVLFQPDTGNYAPLAHNTLASHYGFDASRVWWRVAIDAEWFNEPRARAFLKEHLAYLAQLWRSQKSIPAQLDLQGRSLVSYEATSQYGMLYAAFRIIDPKIASEIFQSKLSPQYRNGFWENDSAYYTQNLAWFGLVPASMVVPYLSQST